MIEHHLILLVEDNPLDLDLTLRAFAGRARIGAIQVARDGREALDCIEGWEADGSVPSVVLLDVKLPKIGGLEVLRVLRAHPRFGAIPVVMLSSSAETADVQTAYSLGANSYIVKPVDYDRFLQVADKIESYWLALNRPPGALS